MADPTLKRIERDSCLICAAGALLVMALTRQLAAGLSVIAGGLLVAGSYWGIKHAVNALLMVPPRAAGDTDKSRRIRLRRRAVSVLLLAGRYALLAFLAYVMIARLRLHPLGLLIGASSIVAAAGLEAVRFVRRVSSTKI